MSERLAFRDDFTASSQDLRRLPEGEGPRIRVRPATGSGCGSTMGWDRETAAADGGMDRRRCGDWRIASMNMGPLA